MKLFLKIKEFISGLVDCEEPDRCLLPKGTMRELSIREETIASFHKELDIIDSRQRRIERRQDALKATVDGDESWFLTLERKDKNDGGCKDNKCSL